MKRTRICNRCKLEKMGVLGCLGVQKGFMIPSVFTQHPERDVPTTPRPSAGAAAEESEGQDGLW